MIGIAYIQCIYKASPWLQRTANREPLEKEGALRVSMERLGPQISSFVPPCLMGRHKDGSSWPSAPINFRVSVTDRFKGDGCQRLSLCSVPNAKRCESHEGFLP